MAVATITLFDFVTDATDTAVPNVKVRLTFGYNAATTADGILQPSVQETITDSTGKFTFSKVIPNDLIAPANTVYLIETPFRSYLVAPQSGNGSSQQSTAANVIVNNPLALAPYTGLTSLTVSGPITATGLVTAVGGEVISGGTGATLNASGDLAVRSITASSGSGPFSPTALAGGADYNAAVRIIGGAPWRDLTHPTYGLSTGGTAAANTTAITNALAAAAAGEILIAPPGTYNHNAVTWNKRVSMAGASGQGSVFNYSPTTGTAWTINPANQINDPRTFGFYNVALQGGAVGSGNFANATTGMNVACDYFHCVDVPSQQWGLGLTFGNNAFFLVFTRCDWQFNNQTLIFPSGLTGSGENIRWEDCTFVNSQTFTNAVQFNGNGDFYLNSPSIDNGQLAVTGLGANVRVFAGHFEVVGQNPSAAYISQTAGTLTIHGGTLLVPTGNTNLVNAMTFTDSGDAGNAAVYISGLHAFSNFAATACSISGGIHAFVFMDTQGSWSNGVVNQTTGTFITGSRTGSLIRTSGISGSISNQLDTTMVSGADASFNNAFTFTLTAARLIAVPINLTKGQRITFLPLQDGTGGWAVTWAAGFKGVTWSNTGNTAGKRSSVSFVADSTTTMIQDCAQAPWV